MVLDKAELLNRFQLKTEKVELADGGEVIVSEIGAADYIRLWTDPSNEGSDGKPDMAKLTPALVARCVVSEVGERLFTDEDAAILAKAPIGPFNAIAAVARRLNRLGGEAGNSEPSQSDDSPSD